MVYDAIKITKENVGEYVIDYLWERGASDLVAWYKNGVEDGQRLTTV